MSCFLYFSILLIPLVLGDDEVVCVPTEGENREECVMIYNGVKDNILTLNLTELENIEKFRNNCLDFEKCTAQLKCGAEKALVDTIDDINSFCEASMFRHTKSFENCDEKLIERNSTCIQEWHQLPELDSGDEEALRTACSEFFGKDGCLEKEMSEGCGVDVWNGFKKNQLAMNKITGTCKFD